ncbi:MAG: NAD(P)/FAD-dependent oxidoreductase [Novosphingobium sp.]|nr:NAD(P)/FAD-dependent oxidoreductase [Novosphingobium sp.]
MSEVESHDIIVVGAGFAGLYGIHRLRNDGWDVLGIESGSDVGGVWYHNRYPGARCDTLSVDYSYSFSKELEQEWDWSERYATQGEILGYIRHVADRFDLRRNFVFDTRVTGMERNDGTGLWTIETNTGKRYCARFVLLATGPLSAPLDPGISGLDDFKGELCRTSAWPHEPVSFEGKRIGVVGTGSSGVQSIPEIAKTAGHITVFQRTPAYSIPARNRPMAPAELDGFKQKYSEHRQEVRSNYTGFTLETTGKTAAECSETEQRTHLDEVFAAGSLGIVATFTDVLFNVEANEVVAEYVRDRIRERVEDPETAEKLVPKTYPIGTKRPCLDTGYYEVFNQPNARLVDINDTPIERFTETGIQTSAEHHDLDMIVLATGFDALTGAILAIDPVNGNGDRLSDAWRDGPGTYLGLAAAGFPNLFLISAAGGTSVFGNMVTVAEEAIDWVAGALAWMSENRLETMEARPEAQDEWTRHVLEIGNSSLLPATNSWYVGANVPGKPRSFSVYLGGFNIYTEKCREVAENGYEGFSAR